MDQSYINWGLGLISGMGGFMLNALWRSVRDLQSADRELVTKLGSVEVLVAGQYITRHEFEAKIGALFEKLDRIERKIGHSARWESGHG